jgi:hypothetical protein
VDNKHNNNQQASDTVQGKQLQDCKQQHKARPGQNIYQSQAQGFMLVRSQLTLRLRLESTPSQE